MFTVLRFCELRIKRTFQSTVVYHVFGTGNRIETYMLSLFEFLVTVFLIVRLTKVFTSIILFSGLDDHGLLLRNLLFDMKSVGRTTPVDAARRWRRNVEKISQK